MNGADIVVRRLRLLGVERVFTLCGNGLDPFHAACDRAGMELIDVHNEQAAAYMADTHARLTKSIGVCAVSSGIAHINALTGVLNSYFDGSPVLLITGSSPLTNYGLGHFQELDQVALARPVCKYAERVERVDLVRHAVDEACAAATSGRPGPVHLTIPVDVFEAAVDGDASIGQSATLAAGNSSAGDPDSVAEAAGLIDKAERPLLIAGSGVYYAGGERELAGFARKTNIPIMIPIWDRGSVAEPLNEFAGFAGAASGEPRLRADADLVILVGARVDYRVGYLRPPSVRDDMKVIRISCDADELGQGRFADVAILGDPRSVLRQLTHGVGQEHAAWCKEAIGREDRFRSLFADRPLSEGDQRLNGRHVVELLKPFLDDQTILLVDGGDIGQWAHMALNDRCWGGDFITCGASAVVGFGLPGAIAAKKACPDKNVILLSGDGAAGFTIAELEIAVRHEIPLVMVVADNEAWGIVATAHTERFGKPIASKLGPIRWDRVAEGFGARGVLIADPAEFTAAMQKALIGDGPTLIQVPTLLDTPTRIAGRTAD